MRFILNIRTGRLLAQEFQKPPVHIGSAAYRPTPDDWRQVTARRVDAEGMTFTCMSGSNLYATAWL